MSQVYITDWGRYEILGPVTVHQELRDPNSKEVLEEGVVDPRFHVNACGEVPNAWNEVDSEGEPLYRVSPDNPTRVFGAGGTCFYRFSSEAEFRQVEPAPEKGETSA